MGTEDAAGVMKSGVYRIDLGGGWFYVGSSVDLPKRQRQHIRALRRGDHDNSIIQRVFHKYGTFNFVVLGRFPIDAILEQEQLLLDEHCGDPKCANMALVVGNPMTGRKHSPESRAKMSATRKGRTISLEWRAALSAAGKGKKKPPRTLEQRAAASLAQAGRIPSDATRQKMSATRKGRAMPPFTSEHRAAMSAARKGKKLSAEHRAALSAAGIGRKHSDETKKKMSLAATAWRARVREAAAAAL
jgi:group I intron endonuclease